MHNDLIALAERVEALTGPDHETDLAIATWCYENGAVAGVNYDPFLWLLRHDGYTASLDATVLLVPEGLFIECMGYDQTATPPWYAQLARLTDSHSQPCRSAHSLALALLAAALHAHAQGETK